MSSITDTGAIRIADVYAVLGVAPRANGYDVGYICSNIHGKINMWARYKPENVGGPADLDEATRKSNNYGIVPSVDGAFLGLSDRDFGVWSLVNMTYQYESPTATSWHRITDFAGYDSAASAPCGNAKDVTASYTSDSFDILLPVQLKSVYGLSIGDFQWAASIAEPKYFTVILFWKKTDGSGCYLAGHMSATSSMGSMGTLGTNKYIVKLPTADVAAKTPPSDCDSQLHYLCCLCDFKYTSLNDHFLAKIYPVMSLTPYAKLTIVRNPLRLRLTGVTGRDDFGTDVHDIATFGFASTDGTVTCWGAKNGLWLRGTIENKASNVESIRRTRILFQYTETLATTADTKNETPPTAMYVKQNDAWVALTSVDIPASSTVEVIFDVSAIPYLNSYGSSGGAVRDYVFLLMSVVRGSSLESVNEYMGSVSLHVADSYEITTVNMENIN